MSSPDQYLDELLYAWEETYKKGQLTLWLFLALRDQPRSVAEIRSFIADITDEAMTCEEQSLYRALRKYYDLELVDFDPVPGNRGPDRKRYFITDLGERLLDQFIQRNIVLFSRKRIRSLLAPKEELS